MGAGDVLGVWNGDDCFSKISLDVLESVDGDDTELGGRMLAECLVLSSSLESVYSRIDLCVVPAQD